MMNSHLTMAEIIDRFIGPYQEKYPVTAAQTHVCHQINSCRTEVLGGQYWRCDHCTYGEMRYHSCRSRHCPKCQKQASSEWLEKRQQDLLATPYFHLVFTLPHTLNPWLQRHASILYGLLFKSVWNTMRTFGEDPKRLNGNLGMIAVLHTWSQNLSQHVHLHCLVPGGALSKQGDEWHPAKSNYLFPVKALSRYFRGDMVKRLRRAYKEGQLPAIGDDKAVSAKLDELMVKDWVVYSKAFYQNSEVVLGYLARYTYRIAISERRIVNMDEQSVSFDWKDYRDDGSHKIMKLSGVEFVRRFFLHILPSGFMRIRHFGFMANCHRKKKLECIRRCLQQPEDKAQNDFETIAHSESRSPQIEIQQPTPCPRCDEGHLLFFKEIVPNRGRMPFAA